MNENYLEYKYYASRCEMADEYKKITGEELQPLGEDWENYKNGDLKMNIDEAIKILKSEPDFSLSYYNREIAIDVIIKDYERQSKIIKKALDFINDENNFFEDGENWQNVLKIKKILEGKE